MFERMKEKRNEGGFTLIELLIVIIILAILAAIVVFAVGSTSQNAKVSSCNADAKSVETAAEAYKAQEGSWPASMTAMTTTFADQANSSVSDGPWLRQVPRATVANNGYLIVYPGAAGAGHVDVTTSAGTADYDSSSNPCDKAGS